jgi:hypothetical protein
MPNIRVTKALVYPFSVTNVAGQADLTTPVTPGSSNPAALKTFINPDNPREAAAVALSLSGVNLNNPIVLSTITAFGHTATVGIGLAAAPDLSAVSIGPVGPEVDPPSWAV